jgi:hypothetical protein
MRSQEDQEKIDALAQDVMRELRSVTVRKFYMDAVRCLANVVLVALFLWFIARSR